MAASGVWDQNSEEEDFQHIGGDAAVGFIARRFWVWFSLRALYVVIKVHDQTCRGLCFICTILSHCFPCVFQWKHSLIYKVERKRMHWILSLKYFIIQSRCTETPHQTGAFIGVSYWLVWFTHSLPELETFDTCLNQQQQMRAEPVKNLSLLSADSKKALW